MDNYNSNPFPPNNQNNGQSNGYAQNSGNQNGYSQNGNNYYNNGNPYNNGYNNGYNNYPPNQSCPSFGLWLGLSIACALLASKICGIIAIIYIVFANNAYKQGDYTKYQSNFKTVKIALIIGLVLGIVSFVFGFFFGLARAIYY